MRGAFRLQPFRSSPGSPREWVINLMYALSCLTWSDVVPEHPSTARKTDALKRFTLR